ncbi:MAG: pilus assembly protein [Actinobacteria bacterium]|nr:pilus assembly protein [Actinomycetota bacterium]
MVEFALIAPLFVALVAGVIQFAVALNFWLDLQRLANQGARSAAVNCGTNQCGPTTLAKYLGPKTTATPEGQIISRGNGATVEICYVTPSGSPAGTATAGDPVRVSLQTKFQFVPLIRVGTITLKAKATMRLERKPTSPALPANNGSAICAP